MDGVGGTVSARRVWRSAVVSAWYATPALAPSASGGMRAAQEETLVDEPRVRVERAVAATVRRREMWTPSARVVVAVSGGSDSLCLFGALLVLRAQGAFCAPGEIVVAHLDHRLRGAEGREDAAWVAAFAREQGA